MIVDGINIYPAEIEQTLALHPDVLAVRALPLPHPAHQDVPVALVAVEPGSKVTEKALVDFVRDRIGQHALHRAFLSDELPRNILGKIPSADARAWINGHLSLIREAETAALEEQARARGPNRQISTSFAAEFRVPRDPNFPQVDAWFGELPDENDWPDLPQSSMRCVDTARLWLSRCVRLAVIMLQAARLPVFEAPRIIACLPTRVNGDSWRAQFELPRVDGVPRPTLDSVLNRAIKLTNWMASNPVSADNRGILLAYIRNRVLDTLAEHLPPSGSMFETVRAANRLGIPFRPVSAGVYQLGWGAKACLVDGGANSAMLQNNAATARLSRQTVLPAPIDRMVSGTGRIPVEVFVGGQAAWRAALDRHAELARDGLQMVLTNADTTLDAHGRPISMPHANLFDRTCALILSRQVHGLILAVQSGEFLRSGLPLEQVDRVVTIDGELVEHVGPAKPLTDLNRTRLERLLTGWAQL